MQKPCPCNARKATGTGRTLRTIPISNQGLGGQKNDRCLWIFSDRESFCSVVSSDGKYFRYGRKSKSCFLGSSLAREGLLPLQRIHPAKPQDSSLGHSPQPVPIMSPRVEDTQHYRVQGWQPQRGLPSVPANSVCRNCWCWCHQENFEKVLTRSSSSLLSTKETPKASPVRWLRHQAVKHKNSKLEVGSIPFRC